MGALLAVLAVIIIAMLAIVIIGIGAFCVFLVLLGLLGWHPPGWLLSPGAHVLNAATMIILQILVVIGALIAIAHVT